MPALFELPDPSVVIALSFAIGVLPVAMVMLTAYTKIIVVLALLKNALGLQQVPPPIVTNGLALVLTWYVMYPVGMEIAGNLQQTHGAAGLRSAAVTDVIKAADAPMRNFLRKHASERERAFFVDASRRLSKDKTAPTVTADDFVVLVPAFVLSQLTEAFLIGVIIALPFLVVDLVVANVLMALGMQMMSPLTVSLPLKLVLFVVLDGWSRLSHALVLTYR